MSNHLHVVAYVNPATAWSWSPEDVAQRWMRLFPVRSHGEIDAEASRLRAQAMIGNAERIALCRARLASLSWFMRCLSEPIARRANREDACTGRFWEGRFRCQALLDDAAVVACMAYVDLNPIRAGLASDLAASEHTSVQRRIETIDPALDVDTPLEPVRGPAAPTMPLGLRDYLVLVDLTGRIARPDKRGAIDLQVAPILRRLGLDTDQWRGQAFGIEQLLARRGCGGCFAREGTRPGPMWLKGGGVSRRSTVAAMR